MILPILWLVSVKLTVLSGNLNCWFDTINTEMYFLQYCCQANLVLILSAHSKGWINHTHSENRTWSCCLAERSAVRCAARPKTWYLAIKFLCPFITIKVPLSNIPYQQKSFHFIQEKNVCDDRREQNMRQSWDKMKQFFSVLNGTVKQSRKNHISR